MCPEEGILQAYLDGELNAQAAGNVAGHLHHCPACRQRLARLEETAEKTGPLLERYRQVTENAVRPPRGLKAWSVPPSQNQPLTRRRGIMIMLRQHKWLSGAVAAVLAFGLFLSWAPGRSLAAQFLNVFRMEKIQVIKISADDLAELEKLFRGESGEVDISNFGRIEIHGVTGHEKVDLLQVESLTGIKNAFPDTLLGGERGDIWMECSPSITITPYVEQLNSYLKKHGGMTLPGNLEGRSFTINIPPVFRAHYRQQDKDIFLYTAGDLTVDVPEGVDIMAVRASFLSMPFLPPNLRQQLASISDWQRTLPVPEIRGMPAREVDVNGSQGVYFSDGLNSGILAWRQGDRWRAVGNLLLEEALKAAAEVQ